jgi:Flp pilus assembly protein TadG
VEAVLVLPVFFLLFFGFVQGVMFYMGNNVAQGAANAAYEAARADNGTIASGTSAGHRFLAEHTGLDHANVTVTRSATQVTVTVRGTSRTLVPLLEPPAITQGVSGPTERWVGAP